MKKQNNYYYLATLLHSIDALYTSLILHIIDKTNVVMILLLSKKSS